MFPTIRCQNQFPNEFQQPESLCLKHACKVPNTEQPFACLDLMFLATLVDQLLGFKQGSILHSSNNVNGMNADWPLAAAFYVYQNGL